MQLDIEDPAAIDRVAAEVQEQFPALNVFINNARIQKPKNLTADAPKILGALSVIQTNIIGILLLAEAMLPVLTQQR